MLLIGGSMLTVWHSQIYVPFFWPEIGLGVAKCISKTETGGKTMHLNGGLPVSPWLTSTPHLYMRYTRTSVCVSSGQSAIEVNHTAQRVVGSRSSGVHFGIQNVITLAWLDYGASPVFSILNLSWKRWWTPLSFYVCCLKILTRFPLRVQRCSLSQPLYLHW